MEHIAIMKKTWGLTRKILSGEKKIESRWYKHKRSLWNKIHAGDIVYFKDSGEPVSIKATIEKVLQFDNLTPKKVGNILQKYGVDDGITPKDIPKFFKMFRDKKYCLLIFLKNPQKVPPFNIDKTGYGAMTAWITINNVNQIKIT
ncbi:MAG: ASCH domain-containing protein [Candidatus Micrarchaeota archaeon]